MNQKHTSIVFSLDDRKRIELLAAKIGVSYSDVMRIAIRELFDRKGLSLVLSANGKEAVRR